jgi:hypothetical protein
MKGDKNASQDEQEAAQASYPEFLNEDVFAVPEPQREDEEAEEKQRKIESWHPFTTP